jgi:hypothetical protein
MTRSIPAKVITLAALGLAGGMLLSWPLWDENKRTDLHPVPLWEQMPFEVGTFVSLGLLIVLGILVFRPYNKWLSPIAVSLILLLWILDLNRVQPWVWFYALMLATGMTTCREPDAVTVQRWLIASVYFWGGFQKITPYFADDNFQWFCNAYSWLKPLGQYPILGYGVAVFELGLGVGLLYPPSRMWAKWLTIAFHGWIMAALSPLGLNWNETVIPWNAAMAGMVWLLFSDDSRSSVQKTPAFAWPLLLAAWLGPVLNFFDLWPDAFSWKMYSNTQAEGTFYYISEPPCQNVAGIWKKSAFDQGSKLLLDDWAVDAFNAPMLANRMVFRRMAKSLCRCAEQPDSAGLYILTVNRWDRSAEKVEKIPCSELLKREQ